MANNKKVIIIGAGLAGCEASYQLLKRNYKVDLYEMRPLRSSPAHRTADFAELVCSNSLKSDVPDTSSGLLKSELMSMDSLLIDCAYKTRVEAGMHPSKTSLPSKSLSGTVSPEINAL